MDADPNWPPAVAHGAAFAAAAAQAAAAQAPTACWQMPPAERFTAESGFTLIEVMVVVLMVALMLGLAGPSFQNSLQRNRLQSTVSGMGTALSFARAEAVIRSQPVALCPSVNSVGCGGSNWEAGWLLFVDNGDGAGGTALDGTLNGSEELLRIGDPAPDSITIRSVGFIATDSIVFRDSGRILQNAPGTLTFCDSRGAEDAQGIILQVSGQGRRAVDQDADGVRDNHQDPFAALVCP